MAPGSPLLQDPHGSCIPMNPGPTTGCAEPDWAAQLLEQSAFGEGDASTGQWSVLVRGSAASSSPLCLFHRGSCWPLPSSAHLGLAISLSWVPVLSPPPPHWIGPTAL